ncbi:hypothetical protein DDT91_14260 [Algoriphagus sp. AK58]|nr:hypothetical protein [Algoriphagus sp. AK58]
MIGLGGPNQFRILVEIPLKKEEVIYHSPPQEKKCLPLHHERQDFQKNTPSGVDDQNSLILPNQ